MVIKTLPVLLLAVAVVLAAPVAEVAPKSTPENEERIIRMPIFNRNELDLTTVHAMDIARWTPSADDDDADFSAESEAPKKWYTKAPVVNVVTSFHIVCTLGTPGQEVELVFDSGSSNLWVQSQFFNESSSSTLKSLDETFSVSYGSGKTTGKFYRDKVLIGEDVIDQDFGIATTVTGLGPHTQGVIGFGPSALSSVTNKERVVPTPMDNLVSTGQIHSNKYGVYFLPIPDGDYHVRSGEVTFGGVDTSQFIGNLTWGETPTTYPAKAYWGLSFDNIKFGDTVLASQNTSAISDTGTSLTLLDTTLFQALQKSIPGATVNKGMLSFPKTSVADLKTLTFVLSGKNITLTPEQYLVRPIETLQLGGNPDLAYAWIGENTAIPHIGVILGQKFLEHYYSVYDASGPPRVGFAPSRKPPTVSAPPVLAGPNAGNGNGNGTATGPGSPQKSFVPVQPMVPPTHDIPDVPKVMCEKGNTSVCCSLPYFLMYTCCKLFRSC
ncbi:hypothetical protein BGZ94_004237 [Podila epigama]|nr:hypothetical protein BGZ94_004237 [Podila epigama]